MTHPSNYNILVNFFSDYFWDFNVPKLASYEPGYMILKLLFFLCEHK